MVEIARALGKENVEVPAVSEGRLVVGEAAKVWVRGICSMIKGYLWKLNLANKTVDND